MPLPTTNNVQLDGLTLTGAGSAFVLPQGGDGDWITYADKDKLIASVGNSGKFIANVDPSAKLREATISYYPEEIGHALLKTAFAVQEAQQGPLATVPFPGFAYVHRRFSTGQVVTGAAFIAGEPAAGSMRESGVVTWKVYVAEFTISPATAVTP